MVHGHGRRRIHTMVDITTWASPITQRTQQRPVLCLGMAQPTSHPAHPRARRRWGFPPFPLIKSSLSVQARRHLHRHVIHPVNAGVAVFDPAFQRDEETL